MKPPPGKGTKVFLTIPLTLAIIKAMLVKVHNEILAVPLMNIRETIKIKPEELKFVQNFEVVRVEGKRSSRCCGWRKN